MGASFGFGKFVQVYRVIWTRVRSSLGQCQSKDVFLELQDLYLSILTSCDETTILKPIAKKIKERKNFIEF